MYVTEIDSNNRSTCAQNFQTSQVIPPNSSSYTSPQTSGFNQNNLETHRDNMSNCSFRYNLTSAFRGLNQKASLLVASSPAFSSAWSCFVDFCVSKGRQPLESSRSDLVSWIKSTQGSKTLKLIAVHFRAVKSI